MKDIKILLGLRIKELRRFNKLSQQELAEKINIDQRNLSNIETGRSFPSKFLLEIAHALNVSLPELFEFEHLDVSRDIIINEIIKTVMNLDNDKLGYTYKFIKSIR